MKNLIDVIMIKFNRFLSNLITNKIKVSMVCAILLINGVSTQAQAGYMLTDEDATLLGAVVNLYPELEFNTILTSDLQLNNYLDSLEHIPNIKKGNVTSSFGSRIHPVTRKRKSHMGVDISSPRHTSVYAPANGIIVFSGWKGGYGFTVEIDHGNGYRTLFAHHNKNMVKVGDSVTRSTIIGTVGTTGVSTGPHMHIEVLLNGKQINPEYFID